MTLVAGHPPTLPVLSTGSSRPIVGTTVVLTADVTDADNDAASYHWSVISVPAGSHVQLSDPTAVTPSFTPDIAGDYVVRLIVTDSIGLQSPPGLRDCQRESLAKDPLDLAERRHPGRRFAGFPECRHRQQRRDLSVDAR